LTESGLGSSVVAEEHATAMATSTPKPIVPPSCVVVTPAPLARAMIRAIGDVPDAKWLDPCVGRGAFVSALALEGVHASRIRALDLDPIRAVTDCFARTLRPREFISWSANTNERFSRIVANPPYIALSRMPIEARRAAASTELPNGETIPASANCWLAFLAASLRLLAEGGNLCYVLPAAWDFADYAGTMRAELPNLFATLEVHRSSRPLFPEVLEGSIVLVARGYRQNGVAVRSARASRRVEHGSSASLIKSLTERVSEDNGHASSKEVRRTPSKSRQDVTTVIREKKSVASTGEALLLREVMEIRIGAVTGDSKFFVLSEEQRKALRLPVSALTPIVSRARHLTAGRLNRLAWSRLRSEGEGVWLFRPSPRLADNAAVRSYLDLEFVKGGCNRDAYKVVARDPWYRTPLPMAVHGFMSGMSSWGPWVVFNDVPRLSATNTLYVVRFVNEETIDLRAAWAMWLLTSDARDQLMQIARKYADGLVKYEPGDLERLVARTPTRHRGASRAYSSAVAEMLAGRRRQSRAIADRWFVAK